MKTLKAELLFDCRAELGECIRWDERAQCLYFLDIDNGEIHRFDPSSKAHQVLKVGEQIGCFSLAEAGGFIAGLRSGYGKISGMQAGVTRLTSPAYNRATMRFNDGRCDAAGRFWAGTMYEPRGASAARVYRLGADYHFSEQAHCVVANGIAFSPDNQFMYLADTPNHIVWRYNFDLDSGALSQRTVFAAWDPRTVNYGGRPDGAVVDSAGNYWTCLFGGGRVQQYSPKGQLLAEVKLPVTHVTCACFGDADLKTLYITTARIRLTEAELSREPTAGSVYAVRVDEPGLIEHRFKGAM
jgi:sugar lactone lactonase YvrE